MDLVWGRNFGGGQVSAIATVDAELLRDGLEQGGIEPDGFGGSEEKESIFIECVVKKRDESLLNRGFEVDQDIAAGDEVEFGEGGIFDEILA